jgi:hypothetical protein
MSRWLETPQSPVDLPELVSKIGALMPGFNPTNETLWGCDRWHHSGTNLGFDNLLRGNHAFD